MQLHQLRYALAVAEHRSLTRAAEAIPVSVASVSAAIKDLEKDLGITLFERTTRSVRPTPAGEIFLGHASRVITELEAAVRDLEVHRAACVASITLGTPPTVVAKRLPIVLEGFRRAHPEIGLQLVEAASDQLVKLLRSRKIDLAFHAGLPSSLPEDIETCELDRAEIGIALVPGHPLASRDAVELATLAEIPMVITTRGHVMREIALEVCQRAAIHPHIALEAAVPETAYNFVRSGLGFTILGRTRASAVGLAFVKCIPTPLPRVLTLVWLPGSLLHSTPVKLLRDEICGAKDWLL
jgi:DNA-binding transcriptional LysR family regulator